MKSNRVIVFIQGVTPTADEQALAEKHETRCFVTLTVSSPGAPIPHKYAVSTGFYDKKKTQPVKIPTGYTSFEEYESGVATQEAEVVAPAPSTNPTGKPVWLGGSAAAKALSADDDSSESSEDKE